jgi:F420-dependent oxidoreductase-like protein
MTPDLDVGADSLAYLHIDSLTPPGGSGVVLAVPRSDGSWLPDASRPIVITMKLGIAMGGFPTGIEPAQMGPLVSRLARRADESGFDTLWTMDHFFQIPITGQPPEAPLLEAYALLAFLAAETERIRLGTLVTSVAYRHPGVLVKAMTSIDVLSGGRVIFGVGAGAPFNTPPPGRSPRDFEAYGLGIPFPPLAERFERLEEVVQIALQMWRGDETYYEGTHYQLPRPLNSPNTLQRPHPPILIAGSGEQKTLRLVARYGDMCNLFDLPGSGYADNLKHKLEVLRAHCEDAGRDYDAIEKTVSTFIDPEDGRARVLDHFAELADLGIHHAMVSPRQPWDDATLDSLAAMVPDVHGIAASA